MQNEILEVAGAKWFVREAVSRLEALAAIDMAECTNTPLAVRMVMEKGVERVLADVVRMRPDGTLVTDPPAPPRSILGFAPRRGA